MTRQGWIELAVWVVAAFTAAYAESHDWRKAAVAAVAAALAKRADPKRVS